MDRSIIVFFALAYAIAWTPIAFLSLLASQAGLENWIALSSMAESGVWNDTEISAPQWFVYLITRIQDFSFTISGVVLILWLYGVAGLKEALLRFTQWKVGKVWIAALLPFVFYFIATLLSDAASSFTISIEKVNYLLFSLEAGIVVTLLLRGPMGEELGLRGFALVRLQQSMSPVRASVIIGIFWALWHLPVLLDRDIVSLIAFLLLAFGLSFVFTWLFNSAGGSLLPVMIFHALQNSEETFESLFPELIESNWEIYSLVLLLLLSIFAAIRLRESKQESPSTLIE